MKRSFTSGLMALTLCGALLAAGCPVVPVHSSMQGSPVLLACSDACAELHDDCVSSQVASTFLLIPAYLIAIAGLVVLIGSGGGGSSCGNPSCGNGGLGAGVSCRDARVECLAGCPLAPAPAYQSQPSYTQGSGR